MDFDSWITERFVALNTDETVFVPYVKSILEGDESLEEKIDALDGILSELGDLNVEEFRKEILSRWESEQKSSKPGGDQPPKNLEDRLESILKLNDVQSTAGKEDGDKQSGKCQPPPDSALRAAILNQYKDESDEGSSDEQHPMPSSSSRGGGGGDGGLERNTNAERVANEIKDKREREKADAAKKREKDKEDRAKQKQQAQDRKDKAKKKATKVERKR